MHKQENKTVAQYYRKSQPASHSVSIEILTVFASKVVHINIDCIIISMQ